MKQTLSTFIFAVLFAITVVSLGLAGRDTLRFAAAPTPSRVRSIAATPAPRTNPAPVTNRAVSQASARRAPLS